MSCEHENVIIEAYYDGYRERHEPYCEDCERFLGEDWNAVDADLKNK